MISVRHRFHGRGSLRPVYQNGQTARAPMLNLKHVRRGSNRPYRLAVVVSRKVSKSAVKRNRLRRRLYEAVRTSRVAVPPGTDLVLTVFDERLDEQAPAKLQATIDALLAQAAGNTGNMV